jgi:hypothetical protein
MQSTYLNRAEQARYLNDRGIPVTKGTLTKFASTGGGPRYVIFGNKALSKPEWLDEWVESKMSAPRTSTSDVVNRPDAAA